MADINDMLQENIKEAKNDIKNFREEVDRKFTLICTKLDTLSDTIVKKEDCKNLRQSNDIDIKRIAAYGGLITATITACTTSVVTILKIFYP